MLRGAAGGQRGDGRGWPGGCPLSLPLVPPMMGPGRCSVQNGHLEETRARPDPSDRDLIWRGVWDEFQ